MPTRMLLAAAACVGLAACQPAPSANQVSPTRAGVAEQVQFGRVDGLRPVTISGGGGGATAGAVLGGVAGGVLGSVFGSGTGRLVATGVGAVAGSAAGSALGGRASETAGVEVIVALDNGAVVAVVQVDDQPLRIGQAVAVITSAGGSRVVPR